MQCNVPPALLRRLETARVLAAPAPAMRHTVLRVPSSRLGAAFLVAPFASAMSATVQRAASSRLEAARVLAAPAPAMRHTVLRVP
jgi:hypothetical protein